MKIPKLTAIKSNVSFQTHKNNHKNQPQYLIILQKTKYAVSHEAAYFVTLITKASKPNIKHIYYYALFTFVSFYTQKTKTRLTRQPFHYLLIV